MQRKLALCKDIVIPDYVLDELYFAAMHKFEQSMRIIQNVMELLPFKIVHAPTLISGNAVNMMRDKNDIPILVCAIEQNVDVLLTGDKDFLTLNIDKPKIMTMTEFLNYTQAG